MCNTGCAEFFLILHRNVLFFIRTLNLIFSEKHICRFAPLGLSSPEQCKSHRSTAFFSQKKMFLYDFFVVHWPVSLPVGIWIAVLKLNIYMCEY